MTNHSNDSGVADAHPDRQHRHSTGDGASSPARKRATIDQQENDLRARMAKLATQRRKVRDHGLFILAGRVVKDSHNNPGLAAYVRELVRSAVGRDQEGLAIACEGLFND